MDINRCSSTMFTVCIASYSVVAVDMKLSSFQSDTYAAVCSPPVRNGQLCICYEVCTSLELWSKNCFGFGWNKIAASAVRVQQCRDSVLSHHKPQHLLLDFCNGDEKQRFIVTPNSSSKFLSPISGTGKKV